jgi:ComF family protein
MGGVGRQSVSGDDFPDKIPLVRRAARLLVPCLWLAARPVLWGATSVLDFLIEDTCVLCGCASRPGGMTVRESGDPVAHLLEPVCQPLLFGRIGVTNHPVCARCATGFDVARDVGLLGRRIDGGVVETARGERFGVAGGSEAASTGGSGILVPSVPVGIVSPFMTNDNVLQIIHLIKFGGYRALMEPVARTMSAAVRSLAEVSVDDTVLVPTPMARRDLRRRGFNQAHGIAAGLSRYLGIAGPVEALAKPVRTAPQSRTPHENRAGNVRGVYICTDSSIVDRHVLLVDDLVTTGATAASCAAAIYAAGARRVTVLCFGRAL